MGSKYMATEERTRPEGKIETNEGIELTLAA